MNPETISIDNVVYVRKDTLKEEAQSLDGYPYRIVRTSSAGVFAGYITDMNGQNIKMTEARRIWYWSGAASLSQLAIDGTNNPKECKFPEPVNVELFEVIEILEVTEKAKKSIQAVAIWKQ
jgi:hypothetical protein